MIKTSGASINCKGNERPELPNDNLILHSRIQSTNIIEGQGFMLDVCFPPPWCSSSMSNMMTMSTSVLQIGDESWPYQNLSMMNVDSTQPLKDTKLTKAQMYQPMANEQLYKNHLADTSELTSPSAGHHTRECIRGMPSTNLNSPCRLDQCSTIDYSSSYKYHNVTCTPDPCLSIKPELPPVLHLHKQPVAVPFPDKFSCVIRPYPDPSVISQINNLSSSANTSSSRVPISVQKTQNNFAHEITMKSIEGSKFGMGADELESAKSKYDNNGSLSLCISLSGPKALVLEKLQRKKTEDLHLVGMTNNNIDDATTQNQNSNRREFPMQHETHQRVPPGNCWLNWLRLPNLRFPLIKYRLVNTKVITVCLSYGLFMTDNPKNEGFIIREDQFEGGNMQMYFSIWKSDRAENKAVLNENVNSMNIHFF